jgi:hypothetical protein
MLRRIAVSSMIASKSAGFRRMITSLLPTRTATRVSTSLGLDVGRCHDRSSVVGSL